MPPIGDFDAAEHAAGLAILARAKRRKRDLAAPGVKRSKARSWGFQGMHPTP
jgi:hypothetical protein